MAIHDPTRTDCKYLMVSVSAAALIGMSGLACQPTQVSTNTGPDDQVAATDLLSGDPSNGTDLSPPGPDGSDQNPDGTDSGDPGPTEPEDGNTDDVDDGDGNPGSGGIPEECLEMPNKFFPGSTANVFYGTEYPTHVPLTPGQIMAVGDFGGCSGLLITPEWVLTAEHCGLYTGSQFCIGPNANNPNTCFSAQAVYDQPQGGDMTLIYLGEDVRDTLPGVEPVRIFTGNLDSSWIGVTAEAAGYGTDENGNMGKREFTAEPIVGLWSDTLTIDGEGQHGVCFGDSGGPVMAIASDGSTRVLGALSNGDSSCVGQDNFTRVDVYRDWIESHTGPTEPAGPQPCGTVTDAGSCNSQATTATYCDNGELQVETCQGNDTCGYSGQADGWRCVAPSEDLCQGETNYGSCDSDVLTWCEDGQLLTRDCGFCGESCELYDNNYGFVCNQTECGGLDYQGACNGDVAEWCDNGERKEQDCAATGQVCDWVNNEVGYFCADNLDCGDLDWSGECNGDVVEWCNHDNERETRDCSDYNSTCGYVSDDIGYYCVSD
jgi:hypothetical protein